MRKILFGAGCIVLLLFFSGSDANAQNIVPNWDFELQDLGPWALTGSNSSTMLMQFDVTGNGQSTWSWRRMPGTGTGNGGLTQDIGLIGGVPYNVSVPVAYVESG